MEDVTVVTDVTPSQELKRGPGRPRKDETKAEAPKMVPIRLKYDCWIGEDRHRAVVDHDDDGNPIYRVMDAPLDLARKWIEAGKAERADPFPGE